MENSQRHKDRASATLDEHLAHLPRVQHVIKTLVKVVGGKKLYAENNPRLAQFNSEFRDALKQFFSVDDALVISIEQYRILWHDEVVYTNEKRDDSIAFLLYKDGIGEVTIHESSLEGEIDEFVQIVAEDSQGSNQDDDVVTKLWNADFNHISYRVIDDYLAGEMKESGEETPVEVADQAELLPSLEDKGRVTVKQSDPLESIDAYLKRVIMTNCTSSNDAEREAYFQSMVTSFFAQSDEEIALYQSERESESRDDELAVFAETIFVFTLLQDNPSAVRDVSGVLERIMEYAIDDRDPRTLGRMVSLIQDFRSAHTPPPAIASLCDKLEEQLTSPSIVASFEDELERWTPRAQSVLGYFETIGRPVVEPLLKILHRVDGGRLHRAICGVLINTAGDEIEYVLDRMDIDNTKVARDAVYIASQINIQTLTPRVQELLYYPDRKVKEDMLELVSKMSDPAVPDLLMSAATDVDKAIRCKAMQTAAARGFAEMARYLNLIAFAKDLQEKDSDEQEAIFRALGHVGDAVTVEQLRKSIAKRSLVDFSGKRENKMLAIRALEHIKEPSAIELLQKLARDSNEGVRARALRALTALRERMQDCEAVETS
jgi:hypothetical protein